MNLGRIVIVGMLMIALIGGAALYYLQVYAYYEEVSLEDVGGVQMISVFDGAPEDIVVDNFQAIDSDSAPVRFRACFETGLSQALLTETYEVYETAEPLLAPEWFDCFDAEALSVGIEKGEVIAFLWQSHVQYGVDRVIAFDANGRGFAWQQINACGEVVFDGNPAPEGCPPVPEGSE